MLEVDTKKYRYFKEAAEFQNLPNYVERIAATPADFSGMVGWYSLKSFVPCALSSCRTLHRDGFVVQLNDRRVINVGHVCGRKAFGQAFHAGVKAIEAARDLEIVRDGLKQYAANLPGYEERLQRLYDGPHGINKLVQARRSLEQALPRTVLVQLQRRASKRQNVVSRLVPRTQSEIEIAGLQQPHLSGDSLRYREEPVGALTGLTLFGSNPEAVIEQEVEAPLRLLKRGGATNVIGMKKLFKALNGVVPTLLAAEAAVDEAWAFFQPANFRLIEYLAASDGERAQVRALGDVFGKSFLQQAAA